jgi:hypothetical protein
MGFFSSLKQNLNHGGVKLTIEAPGSASTTNSDPIPVTITLVNGPEARTINSLSVALEREPKINNNDTAQSNVRRDVNRTTNEQVFTLAPGETKVVQMNVVTNLAAEFEDTITQKMGTPVIAKALAGLNALSNTLGHDDYNYYVTAQADVEGIKLDPAAQRAISMNGPGQFGSTINF